MTRKPARLARTFRRDGYRVGAGTPLPPGLTLFGSTPLEDPETRSAWPAPECRASSASPRRGPAPAQFPDPKHALRLPAQPQRLSMVSLLVGVFLIYNTISASVAADGSRLAFCVRSGHARRGPLPLPWRGLLLWSPRNHRRSRRRHCAGQDAVRRRGGDHFLPLRLLSIDRNWLSPGQFVAAFIYGILSVVAGAWLPAGKRPGSIPSRP